MSATQTPAELSADLVGREFDPVTWSWRESDAILYALGVGARPPEDLDYLYEGCGPRVLPTFGVLPGTLAMAGLVSAVRIDLLMVLHGEQSIVCHRPVPPRGSATVVGRVAEVWDKGSAAVVGVEGAVSDDAGPLFTTKATLFVRGAGGFGGERGPSAGRQEAPDRAPDVVVEQATRREQAAIYRLSGDRNPLHIDPAFARQAGFDLPFLHGLCTYGFVGRAVLGSLCDGDAARFGGLSGRFAAQVYPGDTIVTKIWRTELGRALVQAENQRGEVVLSRGSAHYR